MQKDNCEVRVLVKGRPIAEYYHNGKIYVEGRPGRRNKPGTEYEIEIINRNPFEVEAVVSVDGLSVIDGQEAGQHSPGYLVGANDTLRIKGWKVDGSTAAAFTFTGKGEASYGEQMGKAPRSKGAIGVMFFMRRGQYRYAVNNAHRITRGGYGGMPKSGMLSGMGSLHLGQPILGHPGVATMDWMDFDQMRYGNTGDADGLMSHMAPTSLNHVATSMASNAAAPQMKSARRRGRDDDRVAYVASEAPVQNLGTGFGQAVDFATTTVKFERGDMLTMIVIYYDDSDGLRSKGIQVVRPSKAHRVSDPDPFPATSCQPPKGWRG